MANTNGFFGSISGPFAANEEIINKIKADCLQNFSYISKIGICHPINFDLDITGQAYPKIIIIINEDEDNTFQLGKTGMLELEDVHITSIKFQQAIDNVTIDYQYVPKV